MKRLNNIKMSYMFKKYIGKQKNFLIKGEMKMTKLHKMRIFNYIDSLDKGNDFARKYEHSFHKHKSEDEIANDIVSPPADIPTVTYAAPTVDNPPTRKPRRAFETPVADDVEAQPLFQSQPQQQAQTQSMAPPLQKNGIVNKFFGALGVGRPRKTPTDYAVEAYKKKLGGISPQDLENAGVNMSVGEANVRAQATQAIEAEANKAAVQEFNKRKTYKVLATPAAAVENFTLNVLGRGGQTMQDKYNRFGLGDVARNIGLNMSSSNLLSSNLLSSPELRPTPMLGKANYLFAKFHARMVTKYGTDDPNYLANRMTQREHLTEFGLRQNLAAQTDIARTGSFMGQGRGMQIIQETGGGQGGFLSPQASAYAGNLTGISTGNVSRMRSPSLGQKLTAAAVRPNNSKSDDERMKRLVGI